MTRLAISLYFERKGYMKMIEIDSKNIHLLSITAILYTSKQGHKLIIQHEAKSQDALK